MKKWKTFVDSLVDERTQTLEITDVGVVRAIGSKDCLPVNAIDTDSGEEYKGLLVPVEADIDFDPDHFTISKGRLSTSKKSYANNGFDWEIPDADGTMTSVKTASAVKA